MLAQDNSEDTHSGGPGHSAPVPRVGSRLRPAHVPSRSVAGPSSRASPRKPTAAEVKAKEARRASLQVRLGACSHISEAALFPAWRNLWQECQHAGDAL